MNAGASHLADMLGIAACAARTEIAPPMLPNDDGDTLLHQRIARAFLVEARKSTEATKHGPA